MKLIPIPDFPRFFRTAASNHAPWLNKIESLIALVDADRLAEVDAWPHGDLIRRSLEAQPRDSGRVLHLVLPGPRPIPAAIGIRSPASTPFNDLCQSARLVKAIAPFRPKHVGLLSAVSTRQATTVTDALVAAVLAATEEQPSAKRKPPDRWRPASIRLAEPLPSATLATEAGAHTARWLSQLPPNALNPGSYRKALIRLAKTKGWSVDVFDERRLRRLGAGAFLAVASASARRDAAIVRLRYRPTTRSRRAPVALVGKGICFDTGGLNLKSAGSMQNMHADMAGSAVAVGTLLALTDVKHPHPVDVWVALAENRIGPDAYTQQDVVTALDGTTIQVVHTDAEGRMALADTLALAARSKPSAIVDFATLTGACVSALTERISGFFTNQAALRSVAEEAGHRSGERVHGFPMPDDFDEELESPTADVAQCLIGGKGDHIYAARFLSRFVSPSTPWVHCDLSSAERNGGLGHVPHTITGFGVRFAVALLTAADFGKTTVLKDATT